MDLTCRCKGFYTCVACKVKRGDYRDWMRAELGALRQASVSASDGAVSDLPVRPPAVPPPDKALWEELGAAELDVLDTLAAVLDDCEADSFPFDEFCVVYEDLDGWTPELVGVCLKALQKHGLVGVYADSGDWGVGTKGRAVIGDWRLHMATRALA